MDNTKQAEMPCFHCDPSRQGGKLILIRLDQNGEKINNNIIIINIIIKIILIVMIIVIKK